MAAGPLSLTVDSSARRKSRRGSVLGLVASIAIQASALATLGVSPLLSLDDLPEPQRSVSLRSFVPVIHVPTPPPVAPRGPRTRARGAAPSPTAVLNEVFVPLEDLEEFPTESGFFDPVFEGVPGGDPFGSPDRTASSSPPAPEVQDDTPEILVVRGDVSPPKKLHHESPVYPRVAISARIQGTVLLEARIDEEGNVVDVRVQRSVPLLDQAAIEAVRRWKYEPTLLNGRPVPVVLTVSVSFELSR